jgi:hypothetical protein
MRGYSEFMGCWSRVVYDAGSRSFEARRVASPFADGQAPEAQTETADADGLVLIAAKPLRRPPPKLKPAAARHMSLTGG